MHGSPGRTPGQQTLLAPLYFPRFLVFSSPVPRYVHLHALESDQHPNHGFF